MKIKYSWKKRNMISKTTIKGKHYDDCEAKAYKLLTLNGREITERKVLEN